MVKIRIENLNKEKSMELITHLDEGLLDENAGSKNINKDLISRGNLFRNNSSVMKPQTAWLFEQSEHHLSFMGNKV